MHCVFLNKCLPTSSLLRCFLNFKALSVAVIEGQRLKNECSYFKVTRIVCMKSQNFVIISCHTDTYNLGQNICGLFYVLAQFLFTTSETELNYYHQKVNARVAE